MVDLTWRSPLVGAPQISWEALNEMALEERNCLLEIVREYRDQEAKALRKLYGRRGVL